MKVVITSGGTCEALDSVRVLTNISTGKLGAKIAEQFLASGHDVSYVSTEVAVKPAMQSYPSKIGDVDVQVDATENYHYFPVTNVKSVIKVMRKLVKEADVVIQCMAVPDFTFSLAKPMKLSSHGQDAVEAFIKHIRDTITLTPKVISYYRGWNKNAILVGFKFTVGESKAGLQKIATALMEKNRLDMVFANDKSHMQKAGAHVGVLLGKDGSVLSVKNKDEAAKTIVEEVLSLARVKFIDAW